MATVTVNISFKDSLLAEIDATAKQESRSRSELLREAARAYIDRNNRWRSIFQAAESRARDAQLTEGDILQEIQAYRSEKKASA